jgi:hypothetical protein
VTNGGSRNSQQSVVPAAVGLAWNDHRPIPRNDPGGMWVPASVRSSAALAKVSASRSVPAHGVVGGRHPVTAMRVRPHHWALLAQPHAIGEVVLREFLRRLPRHPGRPPDRGHHAGAARARRRAERSWGRGRVRLRGRGRGDVRAGSSTQPHALRTWLASHCHPRHPGDDGGVRAAQSPRPRTDGPRPRDRRLFRIRVEGQFRDIHEIHPGRSAGGDVRRCDRQRVLRPRPLHRPAGGQVGGRENALGGERSARTGGWCRAVRRARRQCQRRSANVTCRLVGTTRVRSDTAWSNETFVFSSWRPAVFVWVFGCRIAGTTDSFRGRGWRNGEAKRS